MASNEIASRTQYIVWFYLIGFVICKRKLLVINNLQQGFKL